MPAHSFTFPHVEVFQLDGSCLRVPAPRALNAVRACLWHQCGCAYVKVSVFRLLFEWPLHAPVCLLLE